MDVLDPDLGGRKLPPFEITIDAFGDIVSGIQCLDQGGRASNAITAGEDPSYWFGGIPDRH